VGHILRFLLLICLQNYVQLNNHLTNCRANVAPFQVGQVCGKSALSSETLEHKCTNGAFLRLWIGWLPHVTPIAGIL